MREGELFLVFPRQRSTANLVDKLRGKPFLTLFPSPPASLFQLLSQPSLEQSSSPRHSTRTTLLPKQAAVLLKSSPTPSLFDFLFHPPYRTVLFAFVADYQSDKELNYRRV